jgi:selenocysteine lyase/cysteine desulfurase
VDAAQMAAHVPIVMSGNIDPEMDIDALIFSGHKTYAPGSPGVVIARTDLISKIEPEEVGGGMVDRVFPERYYVKNEFPDREEAGTPNILGAITLGAAIHVLDQIGMENVLNDDTQLTHYCMDEMLSIPKVVIYGCTDACPRAGTISFNIKQLNHGLVAAILNDYFNIAVRNECFCAHPYVEKMLELTHRIQIYEARAKDISSWHTEPWMGMVRVSFGIYNTKSDVDHFIYALKDIISKQDEYAKQYTINNHGDYEHQTFQFSCNEYFSLSNNVKVELDS